MCRIWYIDTKPVHWIYKAVEMANDNKKEQCNYSLALKTDLKTKLNDFCKLKML